ncbi:MAG TPA: peptidoglycan-binding protein [Candidatus Kapabacteria bacterium]|nr:peptidoglycan-binding protein [Candidatus Kapabacteria bacterium]
MSTFLFDNQSSTRRSRLLDIVLLLFGTGLIIGILLVAYQSFITPARAITPITWTTTTPTGYTGLVHASSTVIAYNGSYYGSSFGEKKGSTFFIYFTTSTNGSTWSATSTVTSTVSTNGIFPAALEYNTAGGYFGLVLRDYGGIGYYTTSTNGVSWTTPRSITSGMLARFEPMYLDYTSTGIAGLGFVSSSDGNFEVRFTTSSNGNTWTSPTVVASSTDMELIGFQYPSTGAVPHVVYSNNDASAATVAYYYVTSSNNGLTWGTRRIIDLSAFAISGGAGFGLDSNGNPSVVYTYISSGFSVFQVRFASSSNGITWATSTITASANGENWYTGNVVFLGSTPHVTFSQDPDTSSGNLWSATLASNGTWSTTVIDDFVGNSSSKASLATNGTTDLVVVYPQPADGQSVSFGVSAARAYPTATTPSITTSTDGTGIVTLQTTIADTDSDLTNIIVEFSTSSTNGSNGSWVSSTISVTSVSEGAVSAVVGGVTGIDTNLDGSVALTITWDTQEDLPSFATNSTYIRVIPRDPELTGATAVSAAFAIDNIAPSAPDEPSTSPTATTVAVSWSAVSGASTYMVSSTARSVVTTTATSVTIGSLTPTTLYSFQVKAIDAFGNESAYSTATSVYTTAAPVTGSGILIVPPPIIPTQPSSSGGAPSSDTTAPLTVGTPQTLDVDGERHTITLLSETETTATVRVESIPRVVSLSRGTSKNIDTDGDAIEDLRVFYKERASAGPVIQLTKIYGTADGEQAVSINRGAAETTSRQVHLSLHAINATHMAISHSPEFSQSSFIPYATSSLWTLEGGNGVKSVYVRFRSFGGATVDASDEIALVGQTVSPDPTVSVLLSRTLRYGDTGPEVIRLQERLTQLRFLATKAPFGFYGPQTMAAVRAFQKSKGIPQTGSVDKATLNAFNGTVSDTVLAPKKASAVFTRTLSRGQSGADVRALQTFLFTEGYLTVSPTGYFGPVTEEAVKKLQRAWNIEPVGVVGPKTRQRLNAN